MRLAPISPAVPNRKVRAMPDIIWLAIFGGLFLATLAFVRLCDEA
ncbi:hypothetical protein [Sphingomonas sp.]|nr:hypothetical protein [Sphingomonas sp.]